MSRSESSWLNCLLHEIHHLHAGADGITDTDTKEHLALVRLWPMVILLLCQFHVRQCWTNKRKKLFQSAKNEDPRKCFQIFNCMRNICTTNDSDY